jgi:hypothetical protein
MSLARFGGELALRTGGRRPDEIAAATRADLATGLPERFDSARKHACRGHDVAQPIEWWRRFDLVRSR